MFFNIFRDTPHSPSSHLLHRRCSNRARLRGMGSSEVHAHHLCQCVDVQFVARGAVAQCRCYGNGKLLEHRIEHCESRHQFSARAIAVIDLAGRSLVDRTAQINLKNLGMAIVFPGGRCVAGSEANPPGANQLAVAWAPIDLPRNFRRACQMVDEHRMTNGRFRCPEWALFQNCRVEGPPADILAVGNDAISRSRCASVSFFDGENLTRWVGKKHLILPLVCFERMLYISWLVNASFRYIVSHARALSKVLSLLHTTPQPLPSLRSQHSCGVSEGIYANRHLSPSFLLGRRWGQRTRVLNGTAGLEELRRGCASAHFHRAAHLLLDC